MLEGLRQDILALISMYEKTRKERDELASELRKSRETAEEYRKQIIELDREIDNLRLRCAFLAASGDEEAKKKIDRLIREIDKCISIMEG